MPKDEAAAVDWYRQAADAGDTQAMIRLGRMHEAGAGGLAQDDAKARDWFFSKAAARGNTDAKAILVRSNSGPETEDVLKLRREAEAGDANAICQLGFKYGTGEEGFPKDEVEALKWYRKAADASNSTAMFNIGIYYEYGMGGVTKNASEAVKWYRKAADNGNAKAMSMLGTFYTKGRGGASPKQAGGNILVCKGF